MKKLPNSVEKRFSEILLEQQRKLHGGRIEPRQARIARQRRERERQEANRNAAQNTTSSETLDNTSTTDKPTTPDKTTTPEKPMTTALVPYQPPPPRSTEYGNIKFKGRRPIFGKLLKDVKTAALLRKTGMGSLTATLAANEFDRIKAARERKAELKKALERRQGTELHGDRDEVVGRGGPNDYADRQRQGRLVWNSTTGKYEKGGRVVDSTIYSKLGFLIAEAQGHSVDKDRLDEFLQAIPAVLGVAARLGGAALRGGASLARGAARTSRKAAILTGDGRTKDLERRRKEKAEQEKAEQKKAEQEAADQGRMRLVRPNPNEIV